MQSDDLGSGFWVGVNYLATQVAVLPCTNSENARAMSFPSTFHVIQDQGLPFANLVFSCVSVFCGSSWTSNEAGGLPDRLCAGDMVAPDSRGRLRQFGLCHGPSYLPE